MLNRTECSNQGPSRTLNRMEHSVWGVWGSNLSSELNFSITTPGSLAYFSFPLMDSHMTLVYSHYLSLLDTLDSPCLHFDLQPSTLTLASCT